LGKTEEAQRKSYKSKIFAKARAVDDGTRVIGLRQVSSQRK